MMRKGYKQLMWSCLFMTAGCLEPYQPPDVSGELNALVVDGFVNVGDRSATIKLTRTVPLSSTRTPLRETNASVTIEQVGSNISFLIRETEAGGIYSLTNTSFDITKQYRLRIRTKGKTYNSDPVEFKITPEIDSIFFEAKSDGVQVYAATHNPASTLGRYLWTFDETWQHQAFYDPRLLIVNGQIERRPGNESTFNCWTTLSSTKILIGSSENLSQDIMSRVPITFIPKGDPRISVKYSLLLRQQSLTAANLTFWQQIRKTTESVGGLFDALPSQVAGNIHNIANAEEPVMGFFSGGTITSKRIFIDLKKDLPPDLAVDLTGTCPFIEIDPADLGTVTGPMLIVSDAPIYTAKPRCMDCQVDGGTLTKPSFWP